MPYFTTETEKHEGQNGHSADELAIMNRRYDELIEDVEPVNEDEGQTEETRTEEIDSLIADIRDGIDCATEEEKAFVEYLHSCENEDIWFDDISIAEHRFYEGGAVISQGRSSEYAVIPEGEIEDVFTMYIREYADDCILPGKNDTAKQYFDYEAFQHDVECENGYGIMSSYDGNCEEITFDGVTYYIVRLN